MGDFSRIDIMYMLLESIRLSPPGGRWQFLWNPEGGVSFSGGIVFKFFIDFEHSNCVIIEIMKEYHPIFSGKSVEQVRSILELLSNLVYEGSSGVPPRLFRYW